MNVLTLVQRVTMEMMKQSVNHVIHIVKLVLLLIKTIV